MPKTCWSSWNNAAGLCPCARCRVGVERRHLLLGLAAWASPLRAQTLDPCALPRQADFRALARESWPRVVRHGFNELGRGLDGLRVVIIPAGAPRMIGNCPVPTVLNNLLQSPDGRTSGNVLQPDGTRRSPGGRRIFFDVTMLEDWVYQPPNDPKMYGNFTQRRDLSVANDGGGIMMKLHEHPLPMGWD